MSIEDSSNDLLRAHVTRVGFDLSLGKTHVAALVLLNESLSQRRYIPSHKSPDPIARRTFSWFASGLQGCCQRGLVLHHYRHDKRDAGMKWHYTITRAGKLVIDLLKEAGIYQEYADALPAREGAA
jgi:hypothetical protein